MAENATRESIPQPATMRVRCTDRGVIIGCGRLITVPVTYTPVGVSAVVQSADGYCTCGLHIVRVATLYPPTSPTE